MDLEKVLGDGSDMDIVVIRLTDTSQEVDRVRVAHVPVQRLEDVTLCLENLYFSVRRVSAVEEVCGTWSNDFLNLRGDEHACNADELELGQRYDTLGEEAVDDVDAQEQGLG